MNSSNQPQNQAQPIVTMPSAKIGAYIPSNSLHAAKTAIRKKNGEEIEYDVMFEERESFTISVNAVDEEEARDKAWNVYNDNPSSYGGNGGDVDIIDVNESENL